MRNINILLTKLTRQNTRVLIVFGVLAAAAFLMRTLPVEAHYGSGNAFFDMLSHAPPGANLGAGEEKRWWADTPFCETTVEKIQLPDGPGGVKRAAYKFKTWANVNGRGHAMEAGAFADSIQAHCGHHNFGAWDGKAVKTNDGMFIDPTYGVKPSSVKIGVTAADEPILRDEVPFFDIDTGWKNLAGITPSSAGGAYGFTSDASGYRINNQNIWCAGLDFSDMYGTVLGLANTNVQWPGIYHNDCFQNFLFLDGGNYQTNWGAFTIGAMKDGFAKRCGFFCGIGSEIPNISKTNGRVNNFALDVAGVKIHDGVGTYNTNPQPGAIPIDPCTGATYSWDGVNPSANKAAIYRQRPCPEGYWLTSQPVADAWLTMEWAPPASGTIYVSKYEGPTDHKPADGIFNNVDPAINLARACIENQGGTEFACNTDPGANVVVPLNGWSRSGILAQPAPHNPYKVNFYVPAGWRLDHANRPGLTCTGANNTGKCTVPNIEVGEGDLDWVDVWFERTTPPSCNSIQILDPEAANNPFTSSVEVGQPMNIAFSAPTNLPPGATQFSISNLSSSPGGLSGFSGNHGPAALGSQIIVGGISSATPQRYTLSYTVNWNGPSAGSTNCPGEVVTTTKPYLRVYGNDIKAGSSVKINSVCAAPTNPKATILTFARGTSSASAGTEDWKGSATQFAAFTLGEIAEFFSAGQSSPRTNTPPGSSQARPVLDLTFGNYDPNNEIQDHPGINQNSNLLDTRKVEGFGGVGGMAGCFDDYYQAISTGGGTAVGPTVGPKTITGAEAEYRNGDVMINGNIDLAGSWAEGNAPSYYLAVKGNIYIQAGVDRISGVFIALDDGSGTKGRIYTCANGTGLYSSSQLLDACNDRRLTINGAFVAKQVKFLRSINTLRDGAPNEPAGVSRAAEVFNFGPETYMANPHPSLHKGSQKVQYDFITSLPPIL